MKDLGVEEKKEVSRNQAKYSEVLDLISNANYSINDEFGKLATLLSDLASGDFQPDQERALAQAANDLHS